MMQYKVIERYGQHCAEARLGTFYANVHAEFFARAISGVPGYENNEYVVFEINGVHHGANKKRTDRHVATFKRGMYYPAGSDALSVGGSVVKGGR